MDRELDDLEAIDIDYDTKQYDVDVATWWKENGFIENLDILEKNNLFSKIFKIRSRETKLSIYFYAENQMLQY